MFTQTRQTQEQNHPMTLYTHLFNVNCITLPAARIGSSAPAREIAAGWSGWRAYAHKARITKARDANMSNGRARAYGYSATQIHV